MSAFCGIYNLDGRPVDKQELDAITSKLALWQPDKTFQTIKGNLGVSQWQRYYTPEAVYAKFPTQNNYGHSLLASNTRLDNRAELIDLLNIDHSAAKTMPDEEFILRAYEKWQEQCPKYLLGDFVFAIWDENKQQLFLARDRIGHAKAIYYYYEPSKFLIFASNIRPVYSCQRTPIKLDESALAEHLIYTVPFNSATFYSNIFRLSAGHSLCIKNQKMFITKYWDGFGHNKIRYQREHDYIDNFNEIFNAAVKCRLRSSTKIASHLSGGLDSSAVTAIAAKNLQFINTELYAYGVVPPTNIEVIVPPGKTADDGQLMEQVAALYSNIKFTKYYDNSNIFDNLQRFLLYAERPCIFTFNRGWIEGIYEICQKQVMHTLLVGAYGNFSVSWRGPITTSLYGNAADFIKKYLRPVKLTLNHMLGKPPWFNADIISTDFAKKHKMLWNYIHTHIKSYNRLNYNSPPLSVDMGYAYVTYEAIFGVETRDPTNDYQILNYCCSIPPAQFRNKTECRNLIRRAMTNVLPDTICHRTTRGAQGVNWLNALQHDKKIIQDVLPKMTNFLFKYCNTETFRVIIKKVREFTSDPKDIDVLDKRSFLIFHTLMQIYLFADFLNGRSNGTTSKR